jgi:hypothetical protein
MEGPFVVTDDVLEERVGELVDITPPRLQSAIAALLRATPKKWSPS